MLSSALVTRCAAVLVSVVLLLSSVRCERNTTLHQVAVCVAGQVGRWMPQYLMEHFIQPNIDSSEGNYSFHLFFVLQESDRNQAVAHSSGIAFSPTPIANLSRADRLRQLRSIYTPHSLATLSDTSRASESVVIANVSYRQQQPLSHWMELIGDQLRLFRQSNMHTNSPIAVNIMNMYANQVVCAEQIEEYERQRGIRFGYVVSTREDAFFFGPARMADLTRNMLPLGHCHGISKNCLAFGGVNMRLQVYARDAGLLLLSSRFTFFQEVRRTPAVARLTPV